VARPDLCCCWLGNDTRLFHAVDGRADRKMASLEFKSVPLVTQLPEHIVVSRAPQSGLPIERRKCRESRHQEAFD